MKEHTLTDQDVHCITRLLQSVVYGERNSLFDCCDFCKYDCFVKTGVPAKHFRPLLDKLYELIPISNKLFAQPFAENYALNGWFA